MSISTTKSNKNSNNYQFVLATGYPLFGLKLHGPFPDHIEGKNYYDENFRDRGLSGDLSPILKSDYPGAHSDPTGTFLICHGNPTKGFRCVGPFDTTETATHWADVYDTHHGCDCCQSFIVKMELPR